MTEGAPHILVIDSGVGGLSVVAEIARELPQASFAYVADNDFFPYGTKPEAVLIERVCLVAAEAYRQTSPDLIVVACNTASTLALSQLRDLLPVPIVGVVPAIKPASLRSRTGVIGLLGTERTVTARYTEGLIAEFATDLSVIRVGSRNLVVMAEEFLAGTPPDPDAITAEVAPFLTVPAIPDIVVLACTHFPLLREYIATALPRSIELIDSGRAIALRVKSLLADNRVAQSGPAKNTVFYTTYSSLIDTQEIAFNRYGFMKRKLLFGQQMGE